MVMPGFGEAYVPPRIRLSLALLISLVLWPVVRAGLPGLPDGLGGMVGWIIREVTTGLMIGLLLRPLMTALTTAGEIVSLQTTLSFAQTANPLQAQPGSTIASFLMLFGVTLIFATDTHHLFIAGMVGSYKLIAPAQPLMMNDFTAMAVRTVGDSFLLGVQLSAPVLVFALIFNLASGLADRQRLREAERRGLAVFGEDFWPQTLRDAGQTLPRPSLWRRRTDPLAGIGGYDFLHGTPDWSAEAICLAYALTEPAVTSVCVSVDAPADLPRLAAVVDRDLPDSLRAQIELARFSAQEREKAASRA